MGTRRILGAALVALLTIAACGDDGPERLSEDDFLDELSGVCATAQRSFDRLDDPEDVGDLEGWSEEALEILARVKTALAGIAPPDDLARDFGDLREVIDGQIEQFTALREAGADENERDAVDAQEELVALYEEQATIAEDLDVGDCIPDLGDDSSAPTTSLGSPVEPTVGPTVTPTVAPTGTTAAPVTAAPTLPTIPPVITTAPAVTGAPPVDGGAIELDSVAANFAPPPGYTMSDTAADIATDIVAGFELNPVLAGALDVVGVADLVEPGGVAVARLFIAFAREDAGAMPQEWIEYFCGGAGTPVTSPGGFSGETCSLDDGAGGAQHFFAMRGGTAGFVVLSVDPNLDLAGIVDGFFAANPGA